MRVLLLIVAAAGWLWAGSARAETARLLIWSGAASQVEAGRQQASLDRAVKVLGSLGVRFAESYPKLVHSDDHAGLKPGFWIWVLGACADDEHRAVLDRIKLVSPLAYARSVETNGAAPSCPGLDPEAQNPEIVPTSVKAAPARVRVISVEERADVPPEELGTSYRRTRYYVLLLAATGELLAVEDLVGDEDYRGDPRNGPQEYRCTLVDVRSKGSTLTITRECRAAFAECGADISGTEIERFSVEGDRLRRKSTRKNVERLECD